MCKLGEKALTRERERQNRNQVYLRQSVVTFLREARRYVDDAERHLAGEKLREADSDLGITLGLLDEARRYVRLMAGV